MKFSKLAYILHTFHTKFKCPFYWIFNQYFEYPFRWTIIQYFGYPFRWIFNQYFGYPFFWIFVQYFGYPFFWISSIFWISIFLDFVNILRVTDLASDDPAACRSLVLAFSGGLQILSPIFFRKILLAQICLTDGHMVFQNFLRRTIRRLADP